MMNRDNWGVKRVCLSCGARFYDFEKSPIICPACAAVFDTEYFTKKKSRNTFEKNENLDIEIDIVDNGLVEDSDADIEELEEDEDISLNDSKD